MQAEIQLALGIYRNPVSHSALLQPQTPLPIQPGVMLELATGKGLDDYPDAQRAEISQAALFFVRQVFLAPGSDHYRVLGLRPSDEPEQVKRHYRLLMRLFHPDRDVSDEGWGELYAARLNQAYTVLSDPEARAAYDRQQRPMPTLPPPSARPQWRPQPERESRSLGPVMTALLPDTPTKALAWLWLAALLLIGWFYLTQVQPLPEMEIADNLPPVTPLLRQAAEVPQPEPVARAARTVLTASPVEVREREVAPVTVKLEPVARKAEPIIPKVMPRVEAEGAALPAPVRQQRAKTHEVAEVAPTYLPRLAEPRPVPDAVLRPQTQVSQPAPATLSKVETPDLQVTVPQIEPMPVQVAAPQRTENRTVPEPVAQPEINVAKVVSPVVVPTPSIETSAIETLIDQFHAAYVAGDARRLARLFAANGRAQRALGPREIERTYAAQFAAASEAPVLEFGKLQWQKQGTYARGSGPLRVTTEDDAVQDVRVVVELRQQPDGSVLLTGFYHF